MSSVEHQGWDIATGQVVRTAVNKLIAVRRLESRKAAEKKAETKSKDDAPGTCDRRRRDAV
jgi:hypothetical protein